MPFASMDESAKEKLDQELRFLKESYEAEVISKEEYEKGKERIEKKLEGNGNNGDNNEASESQTPEKKEAEAKTEGKSQIKSEEPTQAKKDVESQPKADIKEEVKEQKKEEKKDNKAFKYAVVFVVLTLIMFFGYSFLKQDKNLEKKEAKEAQFTPICMSDKDCIENSKQGICLEPATKNAKCQYPEKKTKVIVLNDINNCFNCDTKRVLGILESWFGALEVDEISYNSTKGKEIAEKFDLGVLPAYIFDAEITNKTSYNQVRQAFVMKNNSYLMSDNAAASTFYFRRDNIPNRLDFFAKEDGAGAKAEDNLKEFLKAFPNVRFEKHSSASDLAKELGIRTFPTFLVNNRVKFSGIHPAEAIKDNFCSLNRLKECDKELSSNLV